LATLEYFEPCLRALHSARKKNTNTTDECSVIKPLTNSDSASARSKGGRFVSATDATKKIMNTGIKGHINQAPLWYSRFIVRLKLLVKKISTNTAELITNS
jgi:hypothetical protein